MKIRQGFVSNSSSSSFAIWGLELEMSDLDVIIETLSQEDRDMIEDGDPISEYWRPDGLEIYEDYESDIVYIGRSYSSIGDDETGKQFKDGVQEKMNTALGKEIPCYNIEAEISN